MVCVFDTNGDLKWSTYTTTDSQKNFEISPKDGAFNQYSAIGNRIKYMQVYDNHVNLLEYTNNINIVLNKPKQKTITFLNKNHGFYLIDIFSRYSLK
ncbi:MAG: hypothetical protein KAH01_01680 [Caldisericia bacterium]|nr:hypothetical protein [Caldisericia bacterium]